MVSQPQKSLQRQPESLGFLLQTQLDAAKEMLGKQRMSSWSARFRLELTAPGTHSDELCFSCYLLPRLFPGDV